MNASAFRLICAIAALVVGAAPGRGAPLADVSVPARRLPVLELAQRLATATAPAPLPTEFVHPFNPAAFGQPDPEELRAIAAAQAAAAAAVANSKPTTDSELVKVIAARVQPSGTLIVGDHPWLVFGSKRLGVGDLLTVAYDGQNYKLELTAITRTTFTLRLNRDEVTRPIKPGKSP